MRDVLLARVRPLVDRLADDLTELAVRRVEAEIERMGEAFSVALSAYQSDGAPDLMTAALGPELAGMLNAPAPALAVAKRERHYEPANYPPSRRAREQRAEPQANGKKPITCKRCGFVGGNARGCGTAHETRVPRKEPDGPVLPVIKKPPAGNFSGPSKWISPAPLGPPPVPILRSRRERIAALSVQRPTHVMRTAPRALDPDPAPEADQDDELGPWPKSRIAAETDRAEASKLEGSLPSARSSFCVTPPTRAGEFGDVAELDFEVSP